MLIEQPQCKDHLFIPLSVRSFFSALSFSLLSTPLLNDNRQLIYIKESTKLDHYQAFSFFSFSRLIAKVNDESNRDRYEMS